MKAKRLGICVSLLVILHSCFLPVNCGDLYPQDDKKSCQQRLEQVEKTLERLLKVNNLHGETNQDTKHSSKRSDDLGSLQIVLEGLSSKVAQLEAQMETVHQGSTYIRWGHTTCQSGSETIYAGYVGGSLSSETGSGSDLLCLPPNPVYDDLKRTNCGPSTVYGVEYEVCPDPHNDMDIVCALCRSPRATTVMVGATHVCPTAWTEEYNGHLMSSYGGYAASVDYICVDSNPQDRPGSQQSQPGGMLYYTVSKCGSLPCPPYQQDKILSCVVCSK